MDVISHVVTPGGTGHVDVGLSIVIVVTAVIAGVLAILRLYPSWANRTHEAESHEGALPEGTLPKATAREAERSERILKR
ncbi:hypothetical protein AX769_00190 [Frondihabitans sp. PAMC 28766]|nr:hypothetical protein AX769_00190 [Frondihabitans sp. PAMC 28766]